jgi:hypothetical protein
MIKTIKVRKLWSDNVQDTLVVSLFVILLFGVYLLAAYFFMVV